MECIPSAGNTTERRTSLYRECFHYAQPAIVVEDELDRKEIDSKATGAGKGEKID